MKRVDPAKAAMRPKIRKELIARFRQELKRRLPQFRLAMKSSSNEPTWIWKIGSNLAFFVQMQVFDDRDRFVLEIAWSGDDRFPWDASALRRPDVEAPRCSIRLARLWAKGKLEDMWDVVTDETKAEMQAREKAYKRGDIKEWRRPVRQAPEEEVLPFVAPLAEDVVQKLIDYGLPVFRKVAEHQGIPWPDDEVS
jgi:hypothetical protein